VEVPSHLWEHFVGDPRSLALLARHVSSRQPLPPQLVADLTARQRQQPALELQQQVGPARAVCRVEATCECLRVLFCGCGAYSLSVLWC
jgi:hypothetical protein